MKPFNHLLRTSLHTIFNFRNQNKLISIFIFVSCLMPVLALAEENEKSTATGDIGLLSTWAISQITRGGYIKTDAGASLINSNLNGQLSLNGGWRLSQHIKLGFSLNSTLNKVDAVSANIVTIGPTLGYTGFKEMIGHYSVDLTLGAAYAKNSDATDYFEPSIYLINKFPNTSIKHMFWTSGISYQRIGGIGPNAIKSDHLSSINLKLGIVFGSY